jgi:cytochrome bd-type quinol oxidase subunit 1
MYPFWEVPFYTSGIIIALIATFHILPCHLATGAFWFNVYIENKAVKENRPELMEFIRKYSLLILIFCFVIGSLTGVGIWFAATVASPRSISGLIHNYVWGWATEWVFFLIEIAAIYVYYYTIGRVDAKSHLMLGWLYAWAAWISMVIITGILAFMLSSGKWIETGGFFDGFFNETYWPQLFARTAFMFGIAGVYAVIVASRLENRRVRDEIIRKAAMWGIGGLLAGALFSTWYLFRMPEAARELGLDGGLPYLKQMLWYGGISFAVVLVWFLVCGIIRPRWAGTVSGVAILVILFLGIGAGEGFREGVRRPYIINQYMYGNQIIARDVEARGVRSEVEKFNNGGFLKHLYFRPDHFDLSRKRDRIRAGRLVALYQCGNCHALDRHGVMRPLSTLLRNLSPESPEDIADFMDALGDYPYMPPFAGDDDDRAAIGEYLFTIIRR